MYSLHILSVDHIINGSLPGRVLSLDQYLPCRLCNLLFSELYNHYSAFVPKIMEGNVGLLEDLVTAHKTGLLGFASLNSRCVT